MSAGSSPAHDVQAGAEVDARPLADVCAVIVTYHPKPECAGTLAALAPQVRELLIVDNGSPAASFAPVEAAAASVGARIVRLGSNRGIAAALNVALEHARQQGFTWLATFDQDSRPGEGLLGQMLRVLASYPEPDQVALLTPVQVEEASGVNSVTLVTLARGSRWRLLRLAITSGNLLNVAAASRVGGFDASLFIDYVDHEICLKLRREGYQILEASEVRLLHSLGTMEVRQFLGRRPRVSHHSRLRRYYITRNRALLWRQYGSFDPRWMVDDVHRFLNEVVAVVLWEKDVPGKLWMMARGLFDAARNVRGELGGHPEMSRVKPGE
jgi:rhamnosyltransferase